MKIFTTSATRVIKSLSRLRTGSFFVIVALLGVGTYAVLDTNAEGGGITGCTQKSNNNGCYCHCTTNNSYTTVTIASSSGSSPLTTAPNTQYNFTITVANPNSSQIDGGCDIASYSGNGLAAGNDGLQLENAELTHEMPKTFGGNGHCSWSFTYTTGSTAGWDTLYANGNAVNGDGRDDCDDEWNWAPKFIIHIVTPPVRMALSRTSVPLGLVRVGGRHADSLKVTSTGVNAITINSSAMKSGMLFSSFPTTTNRTLNAGASEIDSAIFSPSARGTFNDSLIFITNSDTIPDQRMGLYVSGQGVQAVFNSTNGNTVAFGNVRAGHTAQQTFSFSNTGDDTLFLQTPGISGSGFSIVSTSGLTFPPNQSGSVLLQFAPTAKQSYTGSLTFTASNGVSVPTVSLSGNGTAPQIQFTTPALLGSIRVGRTLQSTVTFTNAGTDTLHISNVTLTQPSSRYTLGTYSQVVLPNASGTVNVTYQPNQEATDTGTLHISSDDPSTPSASIVISGTGILPHIQVTGFAALGTIKVGQTLQGTVSFTNTGKDTLHVSNASLTQPSTLFSLGAYSQTVLPNAAGTIHIGYTPTQEKTDSASLHFSTDDPNDSAVTILITGSGALPHMTVPENRDTVDLGEIKVYSSATQDIAISDNGGADLTILTASASPTPFSITSKPNIVSAGSTSYVTVSFAPTAPGQFSGMLIVSGDDNANPLDTVFLTGTGINSALSIDPASLAFGAVPVNTTVKDTITLSNTGSASVNILGYKLTTPPNAFAVVDSSTKQVAAGGTAIIIVSFRPDSAIAFSGSLALTTDDNGTPIRTINMSGHGVKGALAAAPSPIEFGSVTIGRDSVIQATLKNTGQASVTISSVTMSGSTAFSNGNIATPLTINAGDSSTFDVTFTPTATGDATGSIAFLLADATSINVALDGFGVNGAIVNQNLSEPYEFKLMLMPNPAQGSVVARITMASESDGKLYLFDEAGHEALAIELGILSEGEHDIAIPTAGLASGSYFVQVRNANGDIAAARLVR